jgi:FAD/FMN-containing dehydrogenase
MDVDQASRAVSAVIAAGMLPAALEMMDNEIIRAVEASVFTAGLPVDAQAVLLVELDGIEAGLDEEAEKVESILRRHGARSVRTAADENERKKLWAARKGSFGAVGRLSPDIMIQDAVVPRSRLPEVLAETYRISAAYKIKLANVFHAGDGNLHPLICFDLRKGDDLERVRQAGREIMETCVRAGGSITGEHGVGLDKSSYLPLIFSDDDMNAMLRVRAAFDPSGLCNPGKIIPLPRGCGEARAVANVAVSEPGAVRGPHAGSPRGLVDATGSSAAIVDDPVATASGTDTAARVAGSGVKPLLAQRMKEGRLTNEFKHLVGGLNVARLSDSSFANSLQSENAERVLVLSPGSPAEISDVLGLAASENQAIVPAGGATFLDAGNVLDQTNLILTTRRLSKLIHHEPADLVATAQAGLTLREFQEQLRQKGQWLPIDPPDDGTATLGGVIATGLSGPHQTGYGPVRSFVIGLRAILADGTTIKAGGNVVKNVAGYDLCKLFTGSYGTLGIITEVTFKLRPVPVESRTIVASGQRSALTEIGRSIAREASPVAVELLSPLLARQIIAGVNMADSVLLIRFAGASRAVVVETANALKVLREERISCATHDEDEELWIGASKAATGGANNMVWRAVTRPGELASFLDDIASLEQDEVSQVGWQWHASLGDGRVRVMTRAPVYPRESVRTLERMRQRAENLGGNLIVERAPVDIKNEIDSWGGPGSATELTKRIKQQLDSQNLLSPGRFFD